MLSSRIPGGSPMGQRSSGKARLLIAVVIGIISLISYFSSSEYNPVTGEKQHISISKEQEIALGLQAVPEMVQQFGGLFPDQSLQDLVDKIGNDIVNKSAAKSTEWQFEFHLLADPNTVNAFALPGGQVFITYALLSRLETNAQLAGVLGHEAGHVIARHSAQRMAKQNLTEGLINAVLVGAENYSAAQTAAVIGQMVNMNYGREDELESDDLGVRFMSEAGYDPRGMIRVMEILAEASGGGQRQPEFFSTHPNPENRIQKIQQAIQKTFPNGVPEGLIK